MLIFEIAVVKRFEKKYHKSVKNKMIKPGLCNRHFNGGMIRGQPDYDERNGQMTPALVITDFDGTLLDDDKQLSQKNLAALDLLKKRGIRTAIATGRSLESFQRALAHLGVDRPADRLPLDYVLFSTGAGVLEFVSQKIIYRQSLSSEHTAEITRYFDGCRMDYMVHKAIPDTAHLLFKSHGSPNADFFKRLSLYNTHARPLTRFEDQFEWVTEVLAILPDHEGMNTLTRIQKELPAYSVIAATSPLDHASLWIEVFHWSVSKSKTAAWLCRRLGVRPDQVMAVGNDFNDLDLLDWAGKGVAVENAPELLKERFQRVGNNNRSGFADAVSSIGL